MTATRSDLTSIYSPALSMPEELVEEARNGRMFILVDDEDRENEGDLVIPAQMATPDAINFMARHARGLICLALAPERAHQLRLPMMSPRNATPHQTAFTVSIEAKDGVTTGISAADRAQTIRVAIDQSKGADDLVSPGHVFPLVARPGGVLIRAGHTEAAVDIARIAGLSPAGVICEIMNDDGTMARLPELVTFAQLHGLKIGTIADLIAFRRRSETLIEFVSEQPFESDFGGTWRMRLYVNKVEGTEHLALVKGEIGEGPTLVRMHPMRLFEYLGEATGRGNLLHAAMDEIAREGRGAVVIIRPSKGGSITELIEISRAPDGLTEENMSREYGLGAQILVDLGVQDIVLLTNVRRRHLVALEGYGLRIVEERAL